MQTIRVHGGQLSTAPRPVHRSSSRSCAPVRWQALHSSHAHTSTAQCLYFSNRSRHRSQQHWSHQLQATLLPDPIPSDIDVTVTNDETLTNIEYDEDSKTVRIPLKELGEGARRTKLVMFTCNMCGGRTSRMVNPHAWEKGVVFGQCQHCEVWHTLASNNKKILEEIRYKDYEIGSDGASSSSGSSSSSSEADTSLSSDIGISGTTSSSTSQ